MDIIKAKSRNFHKKRALRKSGYERQRNANDHPADSFKRRSTRKVQILKTRVGYVIPVRRKYRPSQARREARPTSQEIPSKRRKRCFRGARRSTTSSAITALEFFKSLGCKDMFCIGELSEVHHVKAALVVSFARDGIRLHRRLDRRKII
jgi:hypothetical protein